MLPFPWTGDALGCSGMLGGLTHAQSWVVGRWAQGAHGWQKGFPSSTLPPQIEQRIEPAKRAAHSVSKRLQACLQGQCGSEMDKRVVSGVLPLQPVLAPALSPASKGDARPLLCRLCQKVAQSPSQVPSQQWPPAGAWVEQSPLNPLNPWFEPATLFPVGAHQPSSGKQTVDPPALSLVSPMILWLLSSWQHDKPQLCFVILGD